MSIFFDLEKAYDTTWKYGILRDLHETGLRWRMPVFISKFLDNRNFRVCLGSTFSDPFAPWERRGRIRPQHPLACRKRRLNGAACLPWAATRVTGGKDPGG